MKRQLAIHSFQEERAHRTRLGCPGTHQGWSGGRGSGGKCGEEPLFRGFYRKEWVRQGNQV